MIVEGEGSTKLKEKIMMEINSPDWEINDYDGGYENWLDFANPYNKMTEEELLEWQQRPRINKSNLTKKGESQMTISQLINRGINIIEYMPGRDTPADNTKKITKSWDQFPQLTASHVVNDAYNYAIRPDFNFVDIDFDCPTALNLKDEMFAGGVIEFGRDGRGHTLQEITNPTPFTKRKIEFGDKCLIEMRGKGCYSVAQGKLTDPIGKATIFIHDNHTPTTFEGCSSAFYLTGLICQIVEGYHGSVNDYIIPIVGEMLFKKMTEKDIRAVIDKFLINIGRGERQKETSNSITSIINKNNPSKLENLSWDSKQINQVRKTIECLSQGAEVAEEKAKPTPMTWTALGTIMDTEYEPIEEVVEGMLTPGLWFLASKPKLGKSFLTMQLCHAVATGEEFLGRKVIPGSVLFIALEDNERRINSRAKMMGLTKCDNFFMSFTSPKLMEGLEEAIISKIHQIKADPNLLDVKLVIIDTFIRAKSTKKVGGNDSYEEGSFLIDKFQRNILAEGVCAMANTHDKKEKESKGDDRINRMIGTTAYQGQDGNWRLDRTRGTGIDDDTIFTIVARDLPEQEYAIKLNQGSWSMVGVAEKGNKHDKLTQNILDCVQILQDEGGDAKTVELIKKMRDSHLVEADENKNKLMFDRGEYNITARVKSMRKRGLLVNGDRYASYKVPQIVEPEIEELPF